MEVVVEGAGAGEAVVRTSAGSAVFSPGDPGWPN